MDATTAAADKAALYATTAAEIAAVLEGEPNRIARMATVAAMLAGAFDHYFWTGFYLVDPERPGELVIGPYLGTLGCLRIPFGRGVCGAAEGDAQAAERAEIGADHQFPGHIACDSRSESEVVVPVFDPAGALIAVFDVDATTLAAFDEVDARGLEAILAATFAQA